MMDQATNPEAVLKATEIILIRHGETAWNAERRLQGHIDIPLNAQGELQALALGQALKAENIEAVISSDLLRARQTAQAVILANQAPTQLSLRLDADLRERCFGAFEGLTYAELALKYPLEFAAYRKRDTNIPLPDGERKADSFPQFYQRVVQALGRWALRFTGKTIVVVAHGGVLECAYRAALQMPLATPRDFDIFNASINRFIWQDGEFALQHWGDVNHLQKEALDELNEKAAA